MKPWLVSVILPTHDRERYLVSALDSALGQEYRPIEVIVVDDGSTDGTARVVQGYAEVRYRYQQNQGAAAARNAGVAMSGGEILAFLDSDDLWMPEKLRLQVRFLAENPAVGYCLTRMRTFVEPGTAGDPGRVDLSPPSVGAVPSTLVVRREVFDRVGAFDVAYRVGEDIDWFFRAKDAGVPFAVLPEVLVRRRLHDANLGRQERQAPSPVTNIAKASLDRRRARRLP